MARLLTNYGLSLTMILLFCGCGESLPERKVMQVSIDGYSLGQSPDSASLAQHFEPEAKVRAKHRTSLPHSPFVIYLNSSHRCCLIEGKNLELNFDNGQTATVTAGQKVEQLEETLRATPWEKDLDADNVHILDIPDGYLFLQIAKTQTNPLFGLGFYVRRESRLDRFSLMSKAHQKLQCPVPAQAQSTPLKN